MKGETIVCIAPRCWHGLWKDTQAIMSRIARDNRVLYFDPGRDGEASLTREFVRNLPNFFGLNLIEVSDSLTVIPTPSALPHGRQHLPVAVLEKIVPIAHALNAKSISLQVRRALKHYDVDAPILWLYGLFSTDLVGQFGEKLACYTNYDDFAGFPQNARIQGIVRQFDRQLSSKVDLIFATSQTQTEIHKSINPNTYFVPNAVDYDLFHKALDDNLPLPEDIAQIPRPIIGYVGRLAAQIDVPLLIKLAKTYPRCSLVFVGPNHLPASGDSQSLASLPNTFFVGNKSPSELPNYLHAIDVALIPYSLSAKHVLSGYPTKLHEYLAAGRAVVATAMPELEPFRHVVRLGRTHDEFVGHIEKAIVDYSPEALEARLAVARENTWDRRVTELYDILDRHLVKSRN